MKTISMERNMGKFQDFLVDYFTNNIEARLTNLEKHNQTFDPYLKFLSENNLMPYDYTKLTELINDFNKKKVEVNSIIEKAQEKNDIESPKQMLLGNYRNIKMAIYIIPSLGTILIILPILILALSVPEHLQSVIIIAILSEIIGLILIIFSLHLINYLKTQTKVIKEIYRIETAKSLITQIDYKILINGNIYEKQNDARLEMIKRILLDISREE
jgi:hypothetical protein